MVNSLVGRATNNMLIGPDWALNLEICDICNRDPVQAKDVVKGIKKRLGSKNPKVQLLALTLLETLVKNCGDVVHMHVAERDLLHDMVKIAKKKPDFHVKEKILVLVDTWQEAFGGARGRYPQFYAAYHELLRLGARFPERSARSAPVFTPPQTQPIASIAHNPEIENETGVHSAEADFPTLSLSEMQNARGIMDVLAEMLAAIDPQKREGLKQEVIVDLVEQCHTTKRRLVHLINSTSDESLLSQGLALNDDLQRVLAKHEALLTGTHVVPSQKSNPEKSTPGPSNSETSKAIVPVNPPASAASNVPDLISLAPVTTSGQATSTALVNVNFDLLSGDDYDTPSASNSLAIVPVGETQPTTPAPQQQNALALVPMFSPQTQQPQNVSARQYQNMSARQPSFYPNGNVTRNEQWVSYNQGNNPMWNGQMVQQRQQQQPSQGFGAGMSSSSFPPPPWEAPPATPNQLVGGGWQYPQPHQMNHHAPPMNHQPVYTHQIPQQQMAYTYYPQQMYTNQTGQPMFSNQTGQPMYSNQAGQQMYNGQPGQQMYNGQTGQVYGYGVGYGYGYGQQQNAQHIGTNVSSLSSTVYTGPSMANASYVHAPADKLKKAEDRLFGDLVDFSKVKPKKTTPGIGQSM